MKNIQVEYVTCCICEKEDSNIIFDFGDTKVVKCKHCGLIYNNPRYRKSALNKHHRNRYYPENLMDNWQKFTKISEQNRFVWEKIISQIERFAKRKGKLLDVGCGLGYFLKVAIEHGWDVVGVEPESIAVEFARTHLGVRVINGSLQEALKQKEQQHKFDAVSYLQSFEHVSDPISELYEVKRVLKPTGILFLAVPNFNYLGIKTFGKKQFNIKNPTHVYHYTRSSLHHLLSKTGFRNIQRLVYWGGGRKQFGWAGQTTQWFFRTVGISSEIRIVASP